MADGSQRWVRDELPKLVAAGVIDEATAARIAAQYPADPPAPAGTWLRLVVGVIGALMIGAGVILVVAHNWDHWSTRQRAGLALGLLAVFQVLVTWAALRRPRAVGWREATGTMAVLAFGASLALVSQAYQLQGTLEGFLATWLVCALPVVAVTEGLVSLGLAAVGVVVWALAAHPSWSAPWTERLWTSAEATAFAALVASLVVLRVRERPHGVAGGLLAVVGVGTLWSVWMVDLSTWRAPGVVELASWGLVAAPLSVLAGLWATPPDWARMVSRASSAVLLIVIVAASFDDAWRHTARRDTPAGADVVLGGIVAAMGAVGLAVAYRVTARSGGADAVLGWAVVPLLLGALASTLLGDAGGVVAAVGINAYGLLAGVWLLAAGFERARLGTANTGLAWVSVLLVARFLDSDLDFLARGLGFIAVGVGFVAVNGTILRRRQQEAP
ncbi:MAG: DUF2157 domain-containing protein [Alphaproteobacteria bacterium]|nr:DUF2157 domain-containing protein [Alphaproteobacteria bacterium]